MAERLTLNISLTPELLALIGERVRSGRYQSASEVVREGLRLLEHAEQERQAALDALRERIDEGLRAARRGEVVPGERVFADLRRRSARRRKRPA